MGEDKQVQHQKLQQRIVERRARAAGWFDVPRVWCCLSGPGAGVQEGGAAEAGPGARGAGRCTDARGPALHHTDVSLLAAMLEYASRA